MSINKYELVNGRKKWAVKTTIPIELVGNKDYIKRLKHDMKVKCVNEYVDNVIDSLEYRVNVPNRLIPEAIISVELDDMFALKEENKRLHREIDRIYDMYRVLEQRFNKSR